MTPATLEQARAAKTRVAELLGDLPELRGIGIAFLDEGGLGVKVNLLRRPEHIVIPREIDGVAVIVEIVGPIGALDA